MARVADRLITRPDCVTAKRLRAELGWPEPPSFSAELDWPPGKDSTSEEPTSAERREQSLERPR
jgi:hypothetical protein